MGTWLRFLLQAPNDKGLRSSQALKNLARPAGFEPTTPWFVEAHAKRIIGSYIKPLQQPAIFQLKPSNVRRKHTKLRPLKPIQIYLKPGLSQLFGDPQLPPVVIVQRDIHNT